MLKILFLCLIFFSKLALGNPKNPVVVLSRPLAIDYVALKTNCAPGEIGQIEINKTEEIKNELAILYCSLACGWGTCSSFVFYKNTNQKLEYVGSIEGNFLSVNTDSTSNFPILNTQTQSGQRTFKKMSWILNPKSKIYELH